MTTQPLELWTSLEQLNRVSGNSINMEEPAGVMDKGALAFTNSLSLLAKSQLSDPKYRVSTCKSAIAPVELRPG